MMEKIILIFIKKTYSQEIIVNLGTLVSSKIVGYNTIQVNKFITLLNPAMKSLAFLMWTIIAFFCIYYLFVRNRTSQSKC